MKFNRYFMDLEFTISDKSYSMFKIWTPFLHVTDCYIIVLEFYYLLADLSL